MASGVNYSFNADCYKEDLRNTFYYKNRQRKKKYGNNIVVVQSALQTLILNIKHSNRTAVLTAIFEEFGSETLKIFTPFLNIFLK